MRAAVRALAALVVVAAVAIAPIAPAPPAGAQGTGRPDSDPTAEDAFEAPAEGIHHHETTHFRIHFTTTGPDAATFAFVKQVAATFEQVWRVEITDMGWPAPVRDGDLGGSSLVDVYLVDLGGDAFGYAAADAVSTCGGCDVHGYLVLDNDYAGYRPDPLGALQATAAHEFLHLVHFGMAYDAEGWAYEATAVWMEREVFPDADARTQYLVDFAADPALPLPDFGTDTGGFDRAYGAYVWNVWLSERYGPEIVRDAWIAGAGLSDHVVDGYAAALRDRGILLEAELVAFTAATAAWERGGFPVEPTGYPPLERQPLIERGTTTTVAVDHLAAHVADIPPGGSVTVTVRGPKFVAGGIALVGAQGDAVEVAIDDTLFDGEATVTMADTDDLGRLTLVVVNADPALAVPKPPRSDRPRYLFEDVEYAIGIDVDPGPLAKP